MIDLRQKAGTKVKFLGPVYPDLEVKVGEVGTIVSVDDEDNSMTYKVEFPGVDYSYWIGNDRLVVAEDDPEESELCGWKPRALKAEKELKELKNALKTLSEG